MNTTDFSSGLRFQFKKTNIVDFNSSVRQEVQNPIGLSSDIRVKRVDPFTLGLNIKIKNTLIYLSNIRKLNRVPIINQFTLYITDCSLYTYYN